MNVDDRREALEAISVSAEASVQERLRALELLRELPPPLAVDAQPDYAELLTDDTERLARLIELYAEHVDLVPALRDVIEQRARDIVEERALERRAQFVAVDAQTRRSRRGTQA